MGADGEQGVGALTEQEWSTSSDPQAMLLCVRTTGRASDRKLLLFMSACTRRMGLGDESLFDIQERWADGLATVGEVHAYYSAPLGLPFPAFPPTWDSARSASADAIKLAPQNCRLELDREQSGVGERAAQAHLLRYIMGNPFCPRPALAQPVLEWKHGVIRRLAEAAYHERTLPDGKLDQGRLKVVADALEDAGCNNTEILAHLRGPEPHVRGCYVIDFLTGRE